MKGSDILLWFILIVVVAAILWLVFTGRLQELANMFVDAYWNFLENIARTLRR